MAEEKEPPSRWRGLMGFVQQSQVLLAVAVAGAGLLFNVNAQRREELSLNRTAVEAARADVIRSDFRDDPHNTIAEFKATFPRHAYCAALGFFIAENGRLTRSNLDRPDDQVRSMNDALTLEIEALAQSLGIGQDAFQAFVARSTASAATPDTGPGCAAVHADHGRWPLFPEPECLLVIDSFGQNRCTIQRWTDQRAATIRAEQVAMAATPYRPRAALAPGPTTEPRPEPGLSPAAVPPPQGQFPPPDACGAASPLVFVQFTRPEDRTKIDALRDRMLRAGWQVAPAESRPTGRTDGDIRIYREDQRPCAEALAAAVAAQPEVSRPIQVISLADRYAGLPQGQVELWLPPLADAAP
jgi:hypothetical protein